MDEPPADQSDQPVWERMVVDALQLAGLTEEWHRQIIVKSIQGMIDTQDLMRRRNPDG